MTVAVPSSAANGPFKFFIPSRGSASAQSSGPIRLRIAREKNGRIQGSIRIKDEAMKKARFIIGDRVMVGFDIESISDNKIRICLKRVEKDGYKISRPEANSSNGYIKMTCDDIFSLFPEGSAFETDSFDVDGAMIISTLLLVDK